MPYMDPSLAPLPFSTNEISGQYSNAVPVNAIPLSFEELNAALACCLLLLNDVQTRE